MSQHIEYHKFRGDEHCSADGCRSRKYYVLDGKRYCKRGHEQEGFTQVQSDEDDFNTQGRKTRLKREEREKVERIFSGREARELFLQCYQLVLWKQAKWLVNVKHLPTELETVIRDLWAVRLRSVKGLGDGSEPDSSATDVGFSSTTEGEWTETDGESSGILVGKQIKRIANYSGMPKLVETLALCYLGMVLLRLPASLGDIHRWVERDEILYLRVSREIPREMKTHLPAPYHAALETRSPLKRGDVQKAVKDIVTTYHMKYGMEFPSLNAPLVMFKHIKDLLLPLDVYDGARRLGQLLQFGYSFPKTIGRHALTSYPEVQIISLIVIATKLSHPFDDVVRVPERVTDNSVMTINWDLWQDTIAEDAPKGLRKGEEINVVDNDIFKMTPKEMDKYLDWYQRTWIDDRDQKMPQQILDLFPLDDIKPEKHEQTPLDDMILEKLKQVQRNLTLHKPIPPSEEGHRSLPRPGSYYKYYRTVDDLDENKRAKSFYKSAADNAGLSLEMLVRAVFSLECRLQEAMAKGKRREMEEHYSRINLDDDDDDNNEMEE